MCFTQVITTATAQVGRSPWTERDAFVPLLEAGRRRQCASHTKRCETVPTLVKHIPSYRNSARLPVLESYLGSATTRR